LVSCFELLAVVVEAQVVDEAFAPDVAEAVFNFIDWMKRSCSG
jgi:hypothetical protein